MRRDISMIEEDTLVPVALPPASLPPIHAPLTYPRMLAASVTASMRLSPPLQATCSTKCSPSWLHILALHNSSYYYHRHRGTLSPNQKLLLRKASCWLRMDTTTPLLSPIAIF